VRIRWSPAATAVNMDGCAGLDAPFLLDLIEARAYADGAVLHGYRPATDSAQAEAGGQGR
jgi:hypothetical protein